LGEDPKEEREDHRLDGPRGPGLGELTDAVLGWNGRVLSTTLFSLLDPVRVTRAALNSETGRFMSPLRLFILLFGLLLTLSALVDTQGAMSFSATIGASEEATAAWLAGETVTLAMIDQSYGFWMSFGIWPIMIIGVAPYILLFKLYRPSRTFYGHILAYLVTNNGAVAVQLLIMVALAPFVDVQTNSFISSAVLVLVYLVTTARLMFALYSDTVPGGAVKLLGVILLTPIALVFTGILQFLFLEVLLQLRFDLSFFHLLSLEAELAS
jgi:hypothetical protein